MVQYPDDLRMGRQGRWIAGGLLVLCAPVWAQTLLADQELRRQQERERALEQQETRPDARLSQPVVRPDRIPCDEAPCFPIKAIRLNGEDAERFAWALRAADLADDPTASPVVQSSQLTSQALECRSSHSRNGAELRLEAMRDGVRSPLKLGYYIAFKSRTRIVVTEIVNGAARDVTGLVNFRSYGIVKVDHQGYLTGPDLSDWRFVDPDSLEELGPIGVELGPDLATCVSVL